jgi:hypothetical protein
MVLMPLMHIQLPKSLESHFAALTLVRIRRNLHRLSFHCPGRLLLLVVELYRPFVLARFTPILISIHHSPVLVETSINRLRVPALRATLLRDRLPVLPMPPHYLNSS